MASSRVTALIRELQPLAETNDYAAAWLCRLVFEDDPEKVADQIYKLTADVRAAMLTWARGVTEPQSRLFAALADLPPRQDAS